MDSKELNDGLPNIEARPQNISSFSNGNLAFSRRELMTFIDDVEINICLINNISDQLEKQLKLIGTSKDLATFRERIHLIFKKTNTRIRNTGEDFECLQAVFQDSDRQQDLSLTNIQKTYCLAIKKYVSIQQRIVLEAQQRDDQFWDTNKLNLQDGAKTDEHCVEEKVHHRLRQEQEDILRQRQTILEKIEMDVLDVNLVINSVSGLFDIYSRDENNLDNPTRLEEGYKDSNHGAKCCYRFSFAWCMILFIFLILVVILIICLVVQLSN